MVTAYVHKVLEPGEAISYRARLSPISYLPSILLIVIGVLVAAALAPAVPDGFGRTILVAIGLLVVLAGLVFGVSVWIQRATTEIVVTDRRVILKRGLISRRTVEMNLTRVESVDVRQSILGRALNFGDVLIRGTGAGLEPIKGIEAPLEFRRKVLA